MAPHTPATFIGAVISQLRLSCSVLWKMEARFKGVQFLGSAQFLGRPMISVVRGGAIILGDGVALASALKSSPLGCPQPCILRAFTPQARLVLGKNVGLSSTTLVAGNLIEIGEGTIFGSGAMVLDNDFHIPAGEWNWKVECCSNSKPVRIGRGVFVGTRAIILKGVTIGDRAVIGAGAVVTRDVPAGTTAVGNPSRIVEK